jgi:hypothetical protein
LRSAGISAETISTFALSVTLADGRTVTTTGVATIGQTIALAIARGLAASVETEVPVVGLALTLSVRDITLTLNERDIGLNLGTRNTTLTLPER